MYDYAVAPILYRGVRVSILQTRPRYIMAATTVNTETCIPLAHGDGRTAGVCLQAAGLYTFSLLGNSIR